MLGRLRPGSPAGREGTASGDVILALDAIAVSSRRG